MVAILSRGNELKFYSRFQGWSTSWSTWPEVTPVCARVVHAITQDACRSQQMTQINGAFDVYPRSLQSESNEMWRNGMSSFPEFACDLNTRRDTAATDDVTRMFWWRVQKMCRCILSQIGALKTDNTMQVAISLQGLLQFNLINLVLVCMLIWDWWTHQTHQSTSIWNVGNHRKWRRVSQQRIQQNCIESVMKTLV